jgi:glutamyl-tRNA synthetase
MKTITPITKTKVRFAPSPSGHIHLGNARVAMINYIFALKEQGEFILRVDDTDHKTTDADNIPKIREDLECLGVKITSTPIHQSSRFDLYRQHSERLMKEGWAYYCYCSPEKIELENRLALKANRPPRYNGRCKNLHGEALEEIKRTATTPPVVRFNVDLHHAKSVQFNDELLGTVETPLDAFGDFIIVRANGVASYNFASAIDDMEMQISHIIRGADHLSNTARQMLIWEALKHPNPPRFVHLSLLTGPRGEPLSKREGDSSVRQILARGFLPEAITHYLLSIGNSHIPEQAFSDLGELAKNFTWPSASSVTHHEEAKLIFFNRLYLRSQSSETLLKNLPRLNLKLTVPEATVKAYLELFKENMTTLTEIVKVEALFPSALSANYAFRSSEKNCVEHLSSQEFSALIAKFMNLLKSTSLKSEPEWQQLVKDLIQAFELPKKKLFMGLRLMLTGETHGPELHKILMLIGRENLLQRLM